MDANSFNPAESLTEAQHAIVDAAINSPEFDAFLTDLLNAPDEPLTEAELAAKAAFESFLNAEDNENSKP